MQPYTWTPVGRLAVEANHTAMQAAASMDKNRNAGQKKKGMGGSIGGMLGSIGGAALGSFVGMPQVGAMVGGALGGMAGGAIGGDSQSAMAGAGEGMGMGMAMGSTGAADSIGKGVQSLLGNTGLATAATDTASTALKGAGSDGTWAHSFTGDQSNAGLFSSPVAKTTLNNAMSPGGLATIPGAVPWLNAR